MSNEAPTDALRLVLVPRDPTIRMIEAAFETGHLLARDDAKAVWHSMRAAAPASPLPEGGGWQDISTAPKDGTRIHVWADGYEWPETVLWEIYDDETAQEVGEVGYWTYAETLMADATDDCGQEDWTHWRPLPAPPTGDA